MTLTPIDRIDADIAIVGSGFAGSLTALCLARRGQRVALVERGRHPRFAIGESSTPLANLLIEELADRYDLPRIRAFSKWGTWQRTHPDVACGLKRGFTFFFHEPGAAFADDGDRTRQLMVAASPHDEISDTHWYRPDFDRALVREAEAAGVIYLDETALSGCRHEGSRTILDGTRTRTHDGGGTRSVRITASFVIDASGPRGFLHRTLGLEEQPFRWLPHTHGVYTHFEEVARWDRLVRADGTPPYGPDDAALHHVFPGGWIWVLRFNNGITSAGAALTDPMATRLNASDPAGTWDRLLSELPSVREQFRAARAVYPFVHAPRLAFRSRQVCGETWALLPSAAGVIDPLLSTGFPLTLLGITRLLDVLERTAAGSEARGAALRTYARVTQDELDATEQLVAALYANMSDPLLFKRLGLLYFAAASYSETVRRLGRPERAPGFLLHAHPQAGPELRACADAALQASGSEGAARDALLARIDRAIEPFDTAGLLDRSRRDWYPVLADDLVAGAQKLDATTGDIHRLLERCGLVARARSVLLLLLMVHLLWSAACSSCRGQPALTDAAYRDVVTAFFTGVAAMQTTQEVLARQQFDRVVAVAPEEPAGWANVGLLLLRQQEIDQARERLTKAVELAPDSPEVEALLALLESRAGNLPAATRHWGRVLALRPSDVRAAFALARDTERQGGPEFDVQAQRTLEALLARHDNVAVRLELARLAAKRGDADALQKAIAPLSAVSSRWPAPAQEQLQAIRASSANPRAAATHVAFIKNFLVRDPEYRRAMSELTTPLEALGEPLERFLVLKNPEPRAAAPDAALTFAVRDPPRAPGPLLSLDGSGQDPWVGAVSLTGQGAPVVMTLAAGVDGALAADLNYDFRTDLVLAGESGVKMLRQEANGRFVDVTAGAGLPASVVRTPAHGAWAADIDTDGDLDVVLAPMNDEPLLLRNNGDGTFATRTPFAGVTTARGFAWADLDGEGVPDAAFLQADGVVRVFLNMRGGSFREQPVPSAFPKAAAIAAAEITGDALFDLIALAPDGAIVRLSRDRARDAGGASVTWESATVARVQIPQTAASAVPAAPSPRSMPAPAVAPGIARLIIGDLDNNAASDLVISWASGSRVLLGGAAMEGATGADGASREFMPLAAAPDLRVLGVADLDEDGRLDLLGLQNGAPKIAVGRGAKTYHWQRLRPRAATATGDQRINAFGIGGEVELRAGLHVQKHPIASPIVHIGLGEATQADVIRIIWPNGVLQSEFAKPADTVVAADQRLKGSCPWLFTWNGREMGFVTDLLWRSPLGLRINAQATADIAMTEDWVKVRGDQLVPRDNAYDLRITADLWETHFFDVVSLLVVDHPAGTEVFVDERFAVPPSVQQVIATGPVAPFAAVSTDEGRDVSALLRERDDRHLDFAGRGAYQGITRDHAIELELPEDAPREGPLWLIAQGWVHPTDSSINVAIAQGRHASPRGLSLAVADERGRFRDVRTNLGFPAGKDKTILLDLTGLFPSRDSRRRLRLSTNLEIFWDRLGWAAGRPDVAVTPRRLELATAELRYRGFSETSQPDPSTPERPSYRVAGVAPRWRDLEGFHTRFGDVRELLLGVDDRYVIMNAGDELALRFPAAPPPPAGHVRDFIVIGDGWEKDGDYNTAFSRTVLPLPSHASPRYDRPPGRLEDDPVFRAHPADFEVYHTRYVSPDRARDALHGRPPPGGPPPDGPRFGTPEPE